VRRLLPLFTLLLNATALLPASADAQTVAPAEGRAWVLGFADGKTSTHYIVKAKGDMWTPNFRRIDGIETARNGLPLRYLDVAYTAEGDALDFVVTLVYGAFRERLQIAKVRVTPEQPVLVDALAKYGVEPVTLSIVSVPPTLAYPPLATSASGELEIRVDPVAPNAPGYRVVLINHSARALISVQYEFYDAQRKLLSGRRKNERNEPLAEPGQEVAFEITVGKGADGAWHTVDHADFSTVMWEHGGYDGEPRPADMERALALGRRSVLMGALATLRSMRTPSAALARSAFDQFDPSDLGMYNARKAALADLDRLDKSRDTIGLQRWVAESIAELERWLARIDRAVQ